MSRIHASRPLGRAVLYDDLVELARLCVRRARAATTQAAASVLMWLAKDYQGRAAALRGGELPDIGEDQEATLQPKLEQHPQERQGGDDE
jgi:hypothetical protein